MLNVFYSLFIILLVNIDIILKFYKLNYVIIAIFGLLLLVFVFAVPSIGRKKLKARQLTICRNGCEQLKIFVLTGVLWVVSDIFVYAVLKQEFTWTRYLVHTLVILLLEVGVFLSGILRVYIFSKQLGLVMRIVGVCTWYIPIVNLVVLYKIIKIVKTEVEYENNKLILNEDRKTEMICKTKYPLLLVHGVFFRDYKYFQYWGRIPDELTKNGAVIYYGNHQSASSVKNSSQELYERIKCIIKETGCEKVNIIGHSKGGLDSKYLLTYPDIEKYVASITTINTPHYGCLFTDYIFSKMSKETLESIARKYNDVLLKMGDKNPDFIAATRDLTTDTCKELNKEIHLNPNIFCQSIGSKLNKVITGAFPLNYTSLFVKRFDGNNDGLVGENSFSWGNKYTFLDSKDRRGISHGDVIDLTRENLTNFDVREFYVGLVKELKNIGL